MKFRSSYLLALGPLALMLFALRHLMLGSRTLFFRDVFNLHLPAKLAQALAWQRGTLPTLDPFRAGGQPSLGNLNSLPLYPSNLLYLVADDLWAFNAHFWLHLLVAPFAAYWLARRWKLSPPAAWTSAFCYCLCGFSLSQMSFYNLMPALALTPALIAASLAAADSFGAGESGYSTRLLVRFARLLAVSGLFALLILGGDPILALVAAGLAGTAVLFKSREDGRALGAAGVLALIVSGVAGVLLALPQLVAFLRIVGWSYRGFQGYSEASRLIASWDPRQVVDWFLPFAYGRPDQTFWGKAFFGDDQPLFFTLHPGLLALALVLVSGWPRDRARRWAWLAIGAGLFVALGSFNPLMNLAASMPGGGLLRFPVKLWLAIAVGASLLAGVGAERVLKGDGLRLLLKVLGALSLFLLALSAALGGFGDPVEAALRDLVPAGFADTRVSEVRVQWLGDSLFGGALGLLYCGCFALMSRPAGQRRRLALALALTVHAGSQLFLLRFALLTDDVSAYQRPPRLLAHVRSGEVLVHGGVSDMFGPPSGNVRYPDRRLLWVQRRGWDELYPFAGMQFGHRYELNVSAEGLDSFLTQMTLKAMRQLNDADRVRILRSLGADVLLLDRPLGPDSALSTRLRARQQSFGAEAYVYELSGSASGPRLIGNVVPVPHLNAALSALVHPEFDPLTMVVVAGDGQVREGAVGAVEVLESSAEGIRVRCHSVNDSVLLLARSHLPIYAASVDGVAVETKIANLSRLAVPVPAGDHEVRVWIDPRPFRLAWLGWPAAVLLLMASCRLTPSVERKLDSL